ncbi:MAG: DUF3445 domain-containing protein [Verrucomicrobiales bacterium]|nr:DUF3445 domain-containing protein [Verrucomicrobiales bacterium]
MDFGEMFPDRDYGLQMRFVKGDVGAFYRPTGRHGEITAERREWLRRDLSTHLALLPEGEGLLAETVRMAAGLETLPPGVSGDDFSGLEPAGQCRLLGEHWEADFLLMKPDAEGVFRLCGGCLCFPSHWDLGEKMGRSMAEIHEAVPGLNEALERQIDGFLRRIKAGVSWERANWGLSGSPDLNLHPSRRCEPLGRSVALEEVWWRLENQSLVALPESGGILFGISLVIKPLGEIRADPVARTGMRRALRTMPEELARYKGIAVARERLIELLGE